MAVVAPRQTGTYKLCAVTTTHAHYTPAVTLTVDSAGSPAPTLAVDGNTAFAYEVHGLTINGVGLKPTTDYDIVYQSAKGWTQTIASGVTTGPAGQLAINATILNTGPPGQASLWATSGPDRTGIHFMVAASSQGPPSTNQWHIEEWFDFPSEEPVPLRHGKHRPAEDPEKSRGWGREHVEEKHGWTGQDRQETQEALNNVREEDIVREGGRREVRVGSRVVVIEVGKRDSAGRPMGIITSFDEDKPVRLPQDAAEEAAADPEQTAQEEAEDGASDAGNTAPPVILPPGQAEDLNIGREAQFDALVPVSPDRSTTLELDYGDGTAEAITLPPSTVGIAPPDPPAPAYVVVTRTHRYPNTGISPGLVTVNEYQVKARVVESNAVAYAVVVHVC